MELLTQSNPFKLFGRHDSPVFPMSSTQKEINRALDDFDMRWNQFGFEKDSGNFIVACETEDHDKEYVVRFEVPGVKKDDIDIEIDSNTLSISGHRSQNKKEKEKNGKLRRSEFRYGSFYRSFTLPSSVDPEKATAEYKDGVLCVSLPKNGDESLKKLKIT